MSEQTTERCANCIYWESYIPARGMGDCKRYPPITTPFLSPATSEWCNYTCQPEADESDWCGEWRGKK